jgi:hypothetical protein
LAVGLDVASDRQIGGVDVTSTDLCVVDVACIEYVCAISGNFIEVMRVDDAQGAKILTQLTTPSEATFEGLHPNYARTISAKTAIYICNESLRE